MAREWERLRKRFELIEGEQKLTCHFILVWHLSGQFLHGDVIERTHDDDGPLEISCRVEGYERAVFLAEIMRFRNPPSLSRTLS